MARFHPIKVSWPTKSALHFSQDGNMGISFLRYTVIPSGQSIPEERAEIEGADAIGIFQKAPLIQVSYSIFAASSSHFS
jgi:hypothetical protein